VEDLVLDFLSRSHNPTSKRRRKSLGWIVGDSVIIAGIAFVARLPEAWPSTVDIWCAGKAFFYALLVQLAVERGLRGRGGSG
jgi:hypothetical protein